MSFPPRRLRRGLYVYAIRMTATMNPKRKRPRQPALPRRSRQEVRDPRVARLGELVVNYSLGLQPGKVLRIDAPPVSAPLAIEIYRAALAAGAHPYVDLQLERLPELLLAEANDEQLEYVSPISLAESSSSTRS